MKTGFQCGNSHPIPASSYHGVAPVPGTPLNLSAATPVECGMMAVNQGLYKILCIISLKPIKFTILHTG